MSRLLLIIMFGCLALLTHGQQIPAAADTDYYFNIRETPESLETGSVIARMIDGLGYRFYWATEGLKQSDLDYKIAEDSRTIAETLEHIYGLSGFVLNAASDRPNVRPRPEVHYSTSEYRQKTLEQIEEARKHFLGLSTSEVGQKKILFQRGEQKSEMDLWNLFNGPLADAIYHTGQIVMIRRAAGNPVSPMMNVFSGQTRTN